MPSSAAPIPPAVIDGGMAAVGLYVWVIIGKYLDHLPLYRLNEIFARMGADITDSTLVDWCGRAMQVLQPLIERIENAIMASNLLHADDTPIRVLLVDDSHFTAATLNNFVWVAFTRSNPGHDLYGVRSFTEFKHWGCHGPLVIDARKKPHHAPELVADPQVQQRAETLLKRYTF